MEIDPGTSIAGAGLAITCAQLWLGRRGQRLDATFRLIELMQEESARNARFELKSIIKSAGTPNPDFASLSAEDRAKLSSVALFFGLAGFLARRKRVDLDVFLDAFGYSVALNHKRLSTYAAWRSSFRNNEQGSLWKDFDWIAARAAKYVDEDKLTGTP